MAAPIIPPERFPQRLADLGFEAYRDASRVEYITPPLRTVPAGPFLMGSDPRKDVDAYYSEQPQHSVTLLAYQIAAYPVTVAEYACAQRAGAVREPPIGTGPATAEIAAIAPTAAGQSWIGQRRHFDHPVVCVSWQDAVAYVSWLARLTGRPWRLLTEAEWEKAARGTDGRIYPWGDRWDKERANTGIGGPWARTAVGTYAGKGDASPFGAHDLAGNVWEWTSSLFELYPYTSKAELGDINSAESRVTRGGSWFEHPQEARTASRRSCAPDTCDTITGFRLAV